MLMNLMSFFNTHVKSHMKNEKGQGMVEYGLIIALVAIALIVTFTALNGDIAGLISGIQAKITGNTPQ